MLSLRAGRGTIFRQRPARSPLHFNMEHARFFDAATGAALRTGS